MSRNDHYAVVIGISDYSALGTIPLEGPQEDVSRLVAWLTAPTGGDLPTENVMSFAPGSIFSSDRSMEERRGRPDGNDIDTLFTPLYEKGQEARVGERLYIMAAGHGISDCIDLHSVALLTADAVPENPLHVALVKRAEWFRRHAAFDEIVLLAECCRDVLGYELTLPDWPERWSHGRAHPRASKVRYLYGFAVGYGKQTRERDFDGTGMRGIFTETVLRALAEALPDAMGCWIDNRFVERLWRSLKCECVYIHAFETGTEARKDIGAWIDYYNTERPHSALGGRTPGEAYDGLPMQIKQAA